MRNPTRRNRNIGTGKQGHGQDNRMVIPEPWQDGLVFYERLQNPVVVNRRVHGLLLRFVVEPVRDGFFHAATPNEISTVLAWLPKEDLEGLRLMVLRQPTQKQQVLRSVWGRLMYFAEPAKGCNGPGVCLEAQPLEPLHWSKSLVPEDVRELRRLEADGHRIRVGRRSTEILASPTSLRSTILYRTLLHEVGHWVEWLQAVERPTQDLELDDPRRIKLLRDFDARTTSSKEDFAHRYATEKAEQMRERGLIPFDRIDESESMKAEGLQPEWFLSMAESSLVQEEASD